MIRQSWNFLRELRRRRVFRTAGIYIVSAWVLLQVVALAFQSFSIPDEALRYVWIAASIGLPVALIFGWFFDITPKGVVRTKPATGSEDLGLRRGDFAIITALAAVTIVIMGGMINEIRRMPALQSGPWYAAERLAAAIAVLPFENLSGDENQDYLSAGLHDALTTTLSRVSRFRVTSRFSTRLMGGDVELPEIRRVLGVDKALFGSVLRDDEQVRINVTLIDLETEKTIWTDSFTRQFEGLIAMQNEITSAIAREVNITLTPEEERQLSPTAEVDGDTYEAYLRAMVQLRRGTPRGYRRAIEILNEAVDNDPTSALAYAAMGIGYSQLGHSPFPVSGASLRARAAADRALEYDPNLAEAHLALGMHRAYYAWDFEGAEESYLRALELNPSHVDAHYHYAWLLELLNRDEEALRHGDYTKELNPLSPFYTAWLAEQYADAGQHERAIKEAQETLDLNPTYPVAWLTLGNAYLDMGRYDEAVAAHEHLRDSGFWGWVLTATLAERGRQEDARLIAENIASGTNNEFTLALTYCSLRDRDACIHHMETAREKRHPWFPWLVAWFRPMRFLHDDPRMQEFADDLGIRLPNRG